MTTDDAAFLEREELPDAFERWETEIPPHGARPTAPAEWAGALVGIRQGTLDVVCEAGGHERFDAGDLLALGWLPIVELRNRGTEAVRLVAVRRRGPPPTAAYLHVTRTPSTSRTGGTSMKFQTVIELGGKTATGFRVPDEVVAALDAGKRPPVTVRIGSHTYQSTVAVMDGVFMLPLSAENREAAGLAAGDEVEVELQLDTAPRRVEVPADLVAALDAEPEARRTFDALSNSNRKWHVLQVTGAKTDETRQRRIAKSVAMLREGRAR